jgi:hypothetical protein
VKKVNKNSPALHLNSPALRWVFGGQIAPSPWPYECNAQIICIGKKINLHPPCPFNNKKKILNKKSSRTPSPFNNKKKIKTIDLAPLQ